MAVSDWSGRVENPTKNGSVVPGLIAAHLGPRGRRDEWLPGATHKKLCERPGAAVRPPERQLRDSSFLVKAAGASHTDRP